MQLSLLKGNEIYTCVLPEKQHGQYWITQKGADGYSEKVISVEGIQGQWIAKSNKKSHILDKNNQKVKQIAVNLHEVYQIYIEDTKETVLLYCEPVSVDRKVFQKVTLPIEGNLLIGRSDDCDIQYKSKYVSSKHAKLTITKNSLIIENLGNSNGTYVNGQSIKQKVLKPGEVVYIIGFKIIIGNGFISMNNPDNQVSYNKAVLKDYKKQDIIEQKEEFEALEEEETLTFQTFYRPPRFRKEKQASEINIDSPPVRNNQEETPLLLLLGPSMTMGLASIVTAIFTLQYALNNNGNMRFVIPTLLMSVSMLIGTILFPILTRKHERKKHKKYEALRNGKYLQYLEEIRNEIQVVTKEQSAILHENHIKIDECEKRILNVMSSLWERTREQDDFLDLRIGLGNLSLDAEIKYPQKRFTIEDDHLQDKLYKLAQEPKVLTDVPILVNFAKNKVSGIVGNREKSIEMTKSLIIQLVSLHSYEDLKLVFLYDKKEDNVWDFVKWLPHVWNKEENLRFIATNPNELKELSVHLEKEMAKREELHEEDLKEVAPYYVVFALDSVMSLKAEMLSTIYKQKKQIGFSVIHLDTSVVNLPKDCSAVIEVNDSDSKIYDKNDVTNKSQVFAPDLYQKHNELAIGKTLANIRLSSSEADYVLPEALTFLDMFEVGKIEHLNALTRWQQNDPTVNLEARIGVTTTGEWFNLDLHEKFHGPHGLVAGMTGSGKSEFIMTYILSLAVNYHPNEVAFILIDYKGGGMANTFTNLPHIAGTITNLDGAAVNRSLISIQSELKRRQAIFSEVSRNLDVSNIDIYKYQKLYRENKVKEPLQHLFIISDEFAELKTQQPEFMEQLVSAARIGRSLGIHLILATQKPSGVVDDQIWSNSKFRIALKVQERADSMDVIKRPDAAELSVTGRFYLQVGYNELFELGQSAWGGAPYYPSNRNDIVKDESVLVIDNIGRAIGTAINDSYKKLNPNAPKQIDEITKYLATIAKEENIKVRSVWLDPIPAVIYLNELKEKYATNRHSRFGINPIIGELDDPMNQRQAPLTLPLSSEGNVIIYGAAGSGKTTYLTTILCSVMETYTPNEVNFYILDFGAETLRAFSDAPHVGEVLLSDEEEKINNLFKMLSTEIVRRKKLCSEYGGDLESYVTETNTEIPSIIVMIQNYSAFTDIYGDKEEQIGYLTREGLKYGIYFILTSLNPSGVRYRISQNFKQTYVLQLNDESDYSSVLGSLGGVYPSKYKGRGIMKSDQVYEFQIAHALKDNTFKSIKEFSRQLLEQVNGVKAKRIPILPEKVNISYFKDVQVNIDTKAIPVGVQKNNLSIAKYDFDRSVFDFVLTQNLENIDFVQGLAEVLSENSSNKVIVVDVKKQFVEDDKKKYRYVHNNFETVVLDMFNSIVERHNESKEARENNLEQPDYDNITFIIPALADLLNMLSPDRKEKLELLFSHSQKETNVKYIIFDTIPNISSYSLANWFKSKVTFESGIWLGDGIANQYQLTVKSSHLYYEEIGDDFGYIVDKGKATLFKLVSSSVSDELEYVEV